MRTHALFALVTLTIAVAVANPDRIGHSILAGVFAIAAFCVCIWCLGLRDSARRAKDWRYRHFFHWIGLAHGFMFLVFVAVEICGLFYGLPKV